MSKRRKLHEPQRAVRARSRRWLFPLLILAALALTGIDAAQVYGLWSSLPGVQLQRLDWRAVARARAALTGEAAEGLTLVLVSRDFSEALHRPADQNNLLEDAGTRIAGLRHSNFGRLQLAALSMQRWQHEHVPPTEWWPRLHAYLEGADSGGFGHFLPELLDAEAAIHVRLGLTPGTAQQLALFTLGHAHGPLLQYFVAQMQELASQRRTAGDEAGAVWCERIVRQLLRQWVLTPAPAGLRLLAADLLARGLAPPTTAAASEPAGQISRACLAWRAAYRARAAAAQLPPALLRIGEEPTADATPGLTRLLALVAWGAAATVGVALVALAAAVLSLRAGPAAPRASRAALGGIIAALAILGVGWIVIVSAPRFVADDALRAESDELGRPRLPLIGAATGLSVAALAGAALALAQSANAARARTVALTVLGTWLVLGALLLVLTRAADMGLAAYDARRARPLDAQLADIAPPNAAGLLDALRAWNP